MVANSKCHSAFFVTARKERLYTTDVTFSVLYESSQPMGKTEFSSTAKNRTNSVSWVRKLFQTADINRHMKGNSDSSSNKATFRDKSSDN